MESNFARVVATTAIWGAFAIVMGMVMGNLSDGSLVILSAIFMIGAAGATSAVWAGGRAAGAQSVAAVEKSKRAGSMRVSRIVDSLSDEELDQLRARLEEREETVPLESLLSQRQKQQR